MTRGMVFDIHGLPAAQGSKRHVGNGVMVESSKAVKPWRQDVVAATRQAMTTYHCAMYRTPVIVEIRFYFPRPRSHYGTGRNIDQLKTTAPSYVGKKPDIDKVLRSTFDAFVTAGLIHDDSLVVQVTASKAFRGSEGPGARVMIRQATA